MASVDDGGLACLWPDFRSWWARESGNLWFDLRKRGMSGFGSCYYRPGARERGCQSAAASLPGVKSR